MRACEQVGGRASRLADGQAGRQPGRWMDGRACMQVQARVCIIVCVRAHLLRLAGQLGLRALDCVHACTYFDLIDKAGDSLPHTM